jgi:hypothetical protein
MREIKLAKWRLYLLIFTTLWSFGIATDFVLTRHAAGGEVRATVLHNAVFAVVVTSILYFTRKDEK